MSADTVVAGYTNPQHLNRYSYVANNPLRYIDPTGHSPLENEYGGGCSTSGYCPGAPSSPAPAPVNYCDTHPTACGGNGGGGSGNNGGNSSTPTPSPVLTPTQTPTPTTTSTGTSPASFMQASLMSNIPPFPPSPFACGWVDCTLSAASTIASAFTNDPATVVPAFIVDVVATGVAFFHTQDDYHQGEISQVRQWALNGTGLSGLVPGNFGLALSFANLLMTLTGIPE